MKEFLSLPSPVQERLNAVVNQLDVKVPLLLQATIAVSTVMVLVVGILPDLAAHLARMSTLV